MIARPVCLRAMLAFVIGCGGGEAAVDAGATPVSTDHCAYQPMPATARAGGPVVPGAVEVGLAQRALDLPVGTALGGNTSRATAIGDQGDVDDRRIVLTTGFNASVGIETTPRVRAIAIRAGAETVLIIHTDSIFSDDTITHAVTARLGPDYAGKVIWTSSHTHTAAEQYSADSKLQVGGGRKRRVVRDRMIDAMTRTAQDAIAGLAPARIGIAVERDFDPGHQVSYDRRPENDGLSGGVERKDSFLAVVRIDSPAGVPLAVLPIFGVHSAILDDDVAMFSTDVSGMYERIIEEHFDREVMVVHLQGAAGDVLASSEGHLAIPDDQPRVDFAMSEANARRFLPQFLPVYEAAGRDLKAEVALELVTRSIALGPDWRSFSVRGGELTYAPFDGVRPADRRIFGDDGAILSPIDEFNAPHGAGLCGDPRGDTFAGARMPEVAGLAPYHSCALIPDAIAVLSVLVRAPFEPPPVCSSTRTTVSALRLGDYLFAAAPGEPLVLWADRVRALSPVAPDKTIVLGYAQGHIGYLLTADDWLRGGFEPSINVWGPLEGERIADQLAEVMQLAVTDTREDAAAGGTDRVAEPVIDDRDLPPADAAPGAGTVPAQVPPLLYLRSGVVPTTTQPAATIPRGRTARFVWIGEDPLAGTPKVVLEREVAGDFVAARRHSGRPVEDLDLLLTWTPDPLRQPTDGAARTHYWALEWQAVTWFGGTAGVSNDLEDRGGVPLGRYRFRVTGTGYALTSTPFEVVTGGLAITATRAGGQLALTIAVDAADDGWRLLTPEGPSNRRFPLARGPVTVELTLASGGTTRLDGVALSEPGRATVTPPSGETVTSVRVLDRFGNHGTAASAL